MPKSPMETPQPRAQVIKVYVHMLSLSARRNLCQQSVYSINGPQMVKEKPCERVLSHNAAVGSSVGSPSWRHVIPFCATPWVNSKWRSAWHAMACHW